MTKLNSDSPLQVATHMLEAQVSLFLVEPVKPLIAGTSLLDPSIAIGKKGISITQVAERLGKVLRVRADGSVIVQQQSHNASKTVKGLGGKSMEVLARTEKPVTWKVRVSKIDRFIPVE